MSAELTLAVADNEERRQAHSNVHDVWGRGLPLPDHIARRLNAPLHQRATWYVGSLAGRVVAGLGCHEVSVRIGDQLVSASAIASVHTLAEYRGHGFAPRLIEFAEANERTKGARLSMLYSDIDPAYYARQGYRQCPAYRGSRAALGDVKPAAGLELFNAYDRLDEMQRLYDSAVGRLPFHIVRPPEYGKHLIDRFPTDQFFWLAGEGRRRGFARAYATDDALVIRDYVVEENRDELRHDLFAALDALAVARNLKRLEGWMPKDAVTADWFTVAPRAKEITMLKPLDGGIALANEHLLAAEQIREIDHV